MFHQIIAAIRSTVFYLFFVPFTVFWAMFAGVLGWLVPVRFRFYVIALPWSFVVIYLARFIVGIRYEVHNADRLPKKAVLVSNHQSAWETYFLQKVFFPQTQVIKKSILHIPFFGWAFRMLRPIAIDRNDRRGAAQQIIDQGKQRLQQENIYVLIFPEGTRREPGQLGRFSKGGAVLAKHAEVPLVPISQNSGYCWRNKSYIKYPGKVDVIVHEPIDMSDVSSDQAMSQVQQAIKEGLNID